MSPEAFCNLVELLREDVTRLSSMTRYGNTICPEIVVGCGVRWLGGEKYTSLINVFDICRSTVYNLRDDF